MADELMYILNDDTQNYPSGVVETFGHLTVLNQPTKMSPRLLRKHYIKILGSVKNS